RVPRVHVVEAMPLALDGDVAGFAEPAPLMTAQLIVTPATGLLNWSATRTESGVVSGWPTVPVWRSPPFTDIWVAPATLAVIVNGLPVNPGAVAVSVFGPAVVPSIQLPTAAMPVASVAGLAPVTLPLPVPGTNVTATPATGLLLASRTITDGGTATAVPVVAV